MATSDTSFSVLQAKLQAWLINLLTVVVEAYELGAVLGKGARVIAGDGVLMPDVIYVPNQARSMVKADAIYGAPGLAVDVLHSGVSEAERAALRRRYAAAHVLSTGRLKLIKDAPSSIRPMLTGITTSYRRIRPASTTQRPSFNSLFRWIGCASSPA